MRKTAEVGDFLLDLQAWICQSEGVRRRKRKVFALLRVGAHAAPRGL